jgi:hypothetical protein
MDADAFPPAVDADKVGTYPALTKSGGGYFYDEVLEYRVWCHPPADSPEGNGDDYYYAFSTYDAALAHSKSTPGAEEPLVLVRQLEYVEEREPGVYVAVRTPRITEWHVEWLVGSKRTQTSVEEMLQSGL